MFNSKTKKDNKELFNQNIGLTPQQLKKLKTKRIITICCLSLLAIIMIIATVLVITLVHPEPGNI